MEKLIIKFGVLILTCGFASFLLVIGFWPTSNPPFWYWKLIWVSFAIGIVTLVIGLISEL